MTQPTQRPKPRDPQSPGWSVPRLVVALLLAPPFLALQAAAQPPTAADPTPTSAAAPDHARLEARLHGLGDSVPAGAALGFIEAGRSADWQRAADYLDLGAFPPDERASAGPDLARRLKLVLDRTLWIEFERLSQSPQGDLDDGLPPALDRIGTIQTESRGEVAILLERSTDSGASAWRISRATVSLIPALYSEFGYGPLIDILPPPFFDLHFLDIQLWQWLALLVLVATMLVFAWAAALLVQRAARPLVARTETDLDDRLIGALTGPLRLSLALLLFAAVLPFLLLAEPVEDFLQQMLTGIAVVAVSWAVLRLIDVMSTVLLTRLERDGRRSVASVVPLGRRAAKAFLLAMALVVLLQNIGVNVTGLVAGLGVGGIAIALAAQKTIENVFGGITVISDQPVRVGDYCSFGNGRSGTVETIGLRSTRIRTLDRTLVTIPNADFSQREIENYAARDRMRLYAILGLRYETTPDQMRYVLAALRKILRDHPRVSNDPARVRFVGFGASSLDLEVFAYVLTPDWNEFLAIREEIYLAMMDAVGEAGSSFAFPSQTLYLGRDSGLDGERAERAAETARGWREQGEDDV